MVVEEILPRISQELIPGTFWIKLKNSKWARSKPVLSPVVLHVRPLVWLCLPYFWLRGWYLFSFEEMLWQIKKPCIHFRIFHQRWFTPSLAGSLCRQSDFNYLRWKCVNDRTNLLREYFKGKQFLLPSWSRRCLGKFRTSVWTTTQITSSQIGSTTVGRRFCYSVTSGIIGFLSTGGIRFAFRGPYR